MRTAVLNWDYTGLTKYYDTWYYVENGELNWNYTDLLSISILGIMLRTVFLTGIKTVFIITTAMNGAILQTVRSTLTIQDL